jgi:hypothetical protein
MLHRLGRYRCRHRQCRPLPPLLVRSIFSLSFSCRFTLFFFAIVGGLIFTVGHTHGSFANDNVLGHIETRALPLGQT